MSETLTQKKARLEAELVQVNKDIEDCIHEWYGEAQEAFIDEWEQVFSHNQWDEDTRNYRKVYKRKLVRVLGCLRTCRKCGTERFFRCP